MNCFQVYLLFVTITCSVIFACDVYDTDTAVCAYELEKLCELDSFPTTIQSIYDSRACLKKNRDILSTSCLNYLEFDKPSVIESCLVEMKTYCRNVDPGGFRLHGCLLGMSNEERTADCSKALVYDEEIIRSRGSISLVTGKGDNAQSRDSWTKYAFTKLNQFAQAKYLRGSISIEMADINPDRSFLLPLEGNGDSNDDGEDNTEADEDDDDYLTTLQEWRQEYFRAKTQQ